MNAERQFEEPTINSKEERLEKERQIALQNGWTRLGTHGVNVRVPLSSEEKIISGEAIASNEMKIKNLNEQKKVFNAEIKSQVSELREDIMINSMQLDLGYRDEFQNHPAFYDHQNNERIYLDVDTGEILAREKARPEDRQLRIA